MTRKKHRIRDTQPKVEEPIQEQPAALKPAKDTVTRYKAVTRSPLGEWWQDNKKRVRLFSMIGGGALIVSWLLFELLNLFF